MQFIRLSKPEGAAKVIVARSHIAAVEAQVGGTLVTLTTGRVIHSHLEIEALLTAMDVEVIQP